MPSSHSETQDEIEVRKGLEISTRELWLSELQDARDEAKDNDDPWGAKTDEEIREIAENTQMRTIYPMLHSSFKLNWEYAEKNKETTGELSGSERTFELSNVNWLLGILETLHRDGLTDQLKQVSTTTLPALREKLRGSLSDAKNVKGGLPDELLGKAAKLLKHRRSESAGLFQMAETLSNEVYKLGVGKGDESFRVQIEQQTAAFFARADHDLASEISEINKYLQKAEALSDNRWSKMEKSMKKMTQATAAVDPKSKGNHVAFPLLPMIFGNNSRKAPIDFQQLVSNVAAKLEEMLEKVIDLVIHHVDKILESSVTTGQTTGVASNVVILKETFLKLDIVEPLQKRFAIPHFIKVKQHDPLLKDGKLNAYLAKHAAQQGPRAVHAKVLSKGADMKTVPEVKALIESNRNAVREEWRDMTCESIQNFFAEQFVALMTNLTQMKNNKSPLSMRSILQAFLEHIIRTNNFGKDEHLQRELSQFIKDLSFKTDSLRSLWARLDGQHDPDTLGAAAARHLERRRQRALTLKNAKSSFNLRPQNGARCNTRPVVEVARVVPGQTFVITTERCFPQTDMDAIPSVRQMLREQYKLLCADSVSAGHSDLFSAAAFVVFKQSTILNQPPASQALTKQGRLNDHLSNAAQQLRAVTASHIMQHYCTEARCEKVAGALHEQIVRYVDRVKGDYRGDLFCLYWLAQFLRLSFRVWLPGLRSTFVAGRPGDNPSCAFQLMLVADKTAGSQYAETYHPTWFGVMPLKKFKTVTFTGDNKVHELPMTDDDRDARVTSDEGPRAAMRMGGTKRPRQ